VRKENEVALQWAEMRMVRWMCGMKLQDRGHEQCPSIRDGDAHAKHQDLIAVDPVQQLIRAKSQQLHFCHIQAKSACIQPGSCLQHVQ